MSKEDKLTPKQEAFVREYLKTGNGTESYRRAYDAENMTDEAIRVEAHRLLQHPNVSLRLSTLEAKAATKAVLDKAWVIERLMRNARIALGEETVRLKLRVKDQVEEVEMSMRDAAAANKALELLGKSADLRMWVEQVEKGGPGDFTKMTDEELIEHAKALGQKLGVGNPKLN